MIEGLKNIGYYILGIGFLLFLLLVSVLMIQGAVWVGEYVLQWLINLAWIVFGINLLILLPLSFFRKTGMVGGMGIFISSYVFGLTLWFLGLLLTYFTWGFMGVFIGLLLGGIGVVPVAMLAMLLNGEFFVLFVLVLLTILTFGSRFLGIYLAGKAEEKNEFIARQKLAAYEQ
jgi:hypothetical protein